MLIYNHRYREQLNKVKSIGLMKGFIMGCCQGFSYIVTFTAFSVTFW
jgi:hypothetical protein